MKYFIFAVCFKPEMSTSSSTFYGISFDTKLKDKSKGNVLCNFLLRTYTLSSPLMSFFERIRDCFSSLDVGGIFIMTVYKKRLKKRSVVLTRDMLSGLEGWRTYSRVQTTFLSSTQRCYCAE